MFLYLMAFFGTSRRVARRTARRTLWRWGAYNQSAREGPYEWEEAPQQVQAQQPEDLVKLLQNRLAKGAITPRIDT
jgi:hypothetical protein